MSQECNAESLDLYIQYFKGMEFHRERTNFLYRLSFSKSLKHSIRVNNTMLLGMKLLA